MRTIIAFDAVARSSSFTRAAAELSVTQAAISYQIKSLETVLGVSLFRRNGRGVVLTEAGRRYMLVVREALLHLEEGTAWTIARRGEQARAVRVLAMQSFASLWLVPRLKEFRQKHPEVDIHIVSWIGGTTRLSADDFDRHSIDVAVLHRSSEHSRLPGLHVEPLVTDFALPVISPDRLRSQNLSEVSDLRHHFLLHATTWPDVWSRWLDAIGHPDLQPAGEMRFQNTGFTVQAALSGLGVAMAHGPLIADDLLAGKLIAPFELSLPVDRAYYMVSRPGMAEAPAVGHFRSWLRDRIARGNAGVPDSDI